MRLWSLHPKYLDASGLVAVWREGLLAKKVLEGKTNGYTHHPQLKRFAATTDPISAITTYLFYIIKEADSRKYKFDHSKLEESKIDRGIKIIVTSGQLNYEFIHLKNKLKLRNFLIYKEIEYIQKPQHHQLFKIINGNIEYWEKV